MAISNALSKVRNIYEADEATNDAQIVAVAAELAIRSTPALVALDSALATKAANITSETAILDV